MLGTLLQPAFCLGIDLPVDQANGRGVRSCSGRRGYMHYGRRFSRRGVVRCYYVRRSFDAPNNSPMIHGAVIHWVTSSFFKSLFLVGTRCTYTLVQTVCESARCLRRRPPKFSSAQNANVFHLFLRPPQIWFYHLFLIHQSQHWLTKPCRRTSKNTLLRKLPSTRQPKVVGLLLETQVMVRYREIRSSSTLWGASLSISGYQPSPRPGLQHPT